MAREGRRSDSHGNFLSFSKSDAGGTKYYCSTNYCYSNGYTNVYSSFFTSLGSVHYLIDKGWYKRESQILGSKRLNVFRFYTFEVEFAFFAAFALNLVSSLFPVHIKAIHVY